MLTKKVLKQMETSYFVTIAITCEVTKYKICERYQKCTKSHWLYKQQEMSLTNIKTNHQSMPTKMLYYYYSSKKHWRTNQIH